MGNKKHVGIVIGLSILLVIVLSVFAARDSRTVDTETALGSSDFTTPLTEEENVVSNATIQNAMNSQAIFKTNKGDITLELFEDIMPITTGNFISLAEDGFYDGTKFHRVIDGFMIQGGDPNTKTDNQAIYGQGGPDENIQDEFIENPLLTNVRGTIAMANTGQPNSGGSQFFINLEDNTGLDFDKQPLSSKHPVFGRVVDGMDVVDAIAKVKTGARDIPVEPVVIESISIAKGTTTEEAAAE